MTELKPEYQARQDKFNFTWGMAQSTLNTYGYLPITGFMLDAYTTLGLTRDEFLCLEHLARYHYNSPIGRATPSLETIRQQMGYAHVNSVARLIKSLEEKEMIHVRRIPGRCSEYDASPYAQAALALLPPHPSVVVATPTPQCGRDSETPTPQCGTPPHPNVDEEENKKKKETKKRTIPPRKKADPLSFGLERETAAKQAEAAAYADPIDDVLIDTAISLLCNGRSPKKGNGTYRDMAEVLGKVHADFGLNDERQGVALNAVRQAVELFMAEKPDLTVYRYPSFSANYGQYLSRVLSGNGSTKKGAPQHGSHQRTIAPNAVPRRAATEAEARAILGDDYFDGG